MTTQSPLSALLRAARGRRTQDEFTAALADAGVVITRQALSAWERGVVVPDPAHWPQLAGVCSITVGEIADAVVEQRRRLAAVRAP